MAGMVVFGQGWDRQGWGWGGILCMWWWNLGLGGGNGALELGNEPETGWGKEVTVYECRITGGGLERTPDPHFGTFSSLINVNVTRFCSNTQ